MIDRTAFAAGMSAIGIAVRQEADSATMALYHDILGHHTDADEWPQFVRWTLESGRWSWFPKLTEIQDALREFRGDPPLLIEATEAYERVLGSGTYCPENGTGWSYRGVREKCGEAAAEAFLAAGGNNAFAQTWDESKRRERFVAAYGEAVRESPESKLLPYRPTPVLPPAERPPSREEAVQVVQQLHDIADVEPTSKLRPLSAEEWDARVERVKRQAAEIMADEAVKEQG